jgi:large subunit ribosomal protein L32e
MNQKLLDFKNKKKAKNPKFSRQDAYKKKKIIEGWRKPRGWDSKQRRRFQAQAIVQPGYGSPAELRGIHKSGLGIVKITMFKQLGAIDPKTQGIIISGKLGFRNMSKIMNEALKLNIKILNISKPEEYIKKKEDIRAKAKKTKAEKTEKKKETVKKEDKASIEDKVSDEDKKKLEKKEIDRLLTKKF